MPISLVIHGGAWAIPDDEVEAHIHGVRAALNAGWELLHNGASALDSCEAAIQVLENDPTFDAGVGSFLNAAGQVEMDAAIMDGRTLNVGAVAALAHVRNPIQLARHILTTEHVMVVGSGAEEIASKLGLPMCHPLELVVERELERWRRAQADPTFAIADSFRAHDTVGALALDEHGNIAAAISTGGTPNKLPGRVGDAPLVGCGFYADNEVGACCATGLGEAIMRVVLSKGTVDSMAQGISAQAAAQTSIENMARRTGGAAGCIVMHRDGSIGIAHNTPRMAFAHRHSSTEPVAAIIHSSSIQL